MLIKAQLVVVEVSYEPQHLEMSTVLLTCGVGRRRPGFFVTSPPREHSAEGQCYDIEHANTEGATE